MKTNIEIKDLFLFDNKIYKNSIKKKITRNLIVILLILFIIVISVKVQTETRSVMKISDVMIYVGIFIVSTISIFVLFFNIVSVFISSLGCDMLSYKTYIITNDNKLISMMFLDKSDNDKSNISKNSLLDKLIDIKNSMNASGKNKTSVEVDTNDLIECIEIINVHSIKVKRSEIEVLCDYKDLASGDNGIKKTIIIYKYYENLDDLMNFLNLKKSEPKESISSETETYRLIDFIVGICSNKVNNLVLLTPFFVILDGDKIIDSLELVIIFDLFLLIPLFYIEKKALEKLLPEENDKKVVIESSHSFRKILMYICFALFVSLLIYSKDIVVLLFFLFFALLIDFFIILYINKKISR